MIHAGFTIDNPFTKSHMVVLESDVETKGNGLLFEVRCPPKGRHELGEHLHLTYTETTEIVSGTAYYKLDGSQHTAKTGEKFVVLPRHAHTTPWNAGDSEMVYRQRSQFERPNPQAVQDFFGIFATIARLARDGKVNDNGFPKQPLQMGTTLKALIKYGTYDATIPIPVQNFIAATLGSLGEALGYKAVYPQDVN